MSEKVITFRVDDKLSEALEEAKWELRKSKSEIVKEAIKEYLKNKAPDIYEKFLQKENQNG